MRPPHCLKSNMGKEKAVWIVGTFSQSQIHIITCLNNLREQILEWLSCHKIWKLVLWTSDDNLRLTSGPKTATSPETWLLTVHSKCKTITPCFHENGHWLVVENSNLFWKQLYLKINGKTSSGLSVTHAPKLSIQILSNQWCVQQITKLWTEVQNVYSHTLHFPHGRNRLISPKSTSLNP